MPPVSREIRSLVGRAQREARPSSRRGPFATRLDRLGVLGVLLMWTSAALVVQASLIAIVTGALLAFVALVATAMMATNTTAWTAPRFQRLPKFLRLNELLKPDHLTPPELRATGWAGVGTSILVMAIGLVHGVIVAAEKLRHLS